MKPKQDTPRRPGKHIHSTGLSLEKFAKVKSSRFDKQRLIDKQRLVHIKRHQQYNKVKAKLIEEGKYHEAPIIPTLEASDGEHEHDAADRAARGTDRNSAEQPSTSQQPTSEAPAMEEPLAAMLQPGKRVKKVKKQTTMQILAAKMEKEKEAAQERQEEARKAAEKRRKAAAVAERRRKAQTVKHFKKTKKGQPIMKYRLEKILQTLGKS